MPFLARRVTGTPGSATITAGIASVFVAATSPSGLIVVIPLLVAGITIDLVVGRTRLAIRPRRAEARYFVAAGVAGTLLFAISLAVFSPEHLTGALVIGTLIARVVGELAVAFLTMLLARALRRAGAGRGMEPTTRPLDHGKTDAFRVSGG
jgi:hypothetical protein